MSDDAEKDALEVLDQAWQSPLESPNALPIDPIAIARKLGIQVYAAWLSENESGQFNGPESPGDPEIYLNQEDSLNRQRFTCAHEIGHYVLWSASGKKERVIDRRDLISSEGTDPKEIYANRFAAALLMPADLVKAHFEKTKNPGLLASRFGVSVQAMNFRLRNLKLVP